jgi:hypothetical protein
MVIVVVVTMDHPLDKIPRCRQGRDKCSGIPSSEYKEMQVLNSLREGGDYDFRDEVEGLMFF